MDHIESKEYLMKTFGLHEDQISLDLHEQSTKSGFDMVFNCVPADADTMRDLWSSLSNFGRFVAIKDTDSNANARFETAGLQKNRSFMSVDLLSIALERPRLMERLLIDVSEFIRQGNTKPLHLTIFSISNVEEAFNSLRNANLDGKMVVLPQAGAMVKVCALIPLTLRRLC
jgi:D-arabinose 1-dehydrogenase-like Zn-dependent alcohol dehydrogenase